MLTGLKNPLKGPKIIVFGHIVQVLLRYKVGATTKLGPHICEVNAEGAVIPNNCFLGCFLLAEIDTLLYI